MRDPGDKTRALVFSAGGEPLHEQPIISGDDASSMNDLRLSPKERLATSLMGDVEPKVAARMRRGRLPKDTVLILNNVPCKGSMGCRAFLPSILPPGSRLAVYVSDGQHTRFFRIFHGTGSRIAP